MRATARITIVLAIVVVVVLLSLRLVESNAIQATVSSFGYLGVFFVSVASGFSIAVPIPTIALLPLFLGSGFPFWPVLLVMTFGMTSGDSIGYFLGSAGRQVAKARTAPIRNSRAYRFLEAFRARHRLWTYVVFGIYVSFVPAPNEILVIPMAFMGYRLRYMFPIMLVGNFVFNTLAAFSVIGLIRLL